MFADSNVDRTVTVTTVPSNPNLPQGHYPFTDGLVALSPILAVLRHGWNAPLRQANASFGLVYSSDSESEEHIITRALCDHYGVPCRDWYEFALRGDSPYMDEEGIGEAHIPGVNDL